MSKLLLHIWIILYVQDVYFNIVNHMSSTHTNVLNLLFVFGMQRPLVVISNDGFPIQGQLSYWKLRTQFWTVHTRLIFQNKNNALEIFSKSLLPW